MTPETHAQIAADYARRRQSPDPRLVATRDLIETLEERRYLPDIAEAEGPEFARSYDARLRRQINSARARGGSESLAYEAGCCHYEHARTQICFGCNPKSAIAAMQVG